MTTIAHKDGIIAYDSQLTGGDVIVDDDYDKMREQDGVKFFIGGSPSDYDDFIDMSFGRKKDINPECSAFIIYEDKLWESGVSGKTIWMEMLELTSVRAFGSGSDFAITAMDYGATAKEAMLAASKRDVYTNDKARTYEWAVVT